MVRNLTLLTFLIVVEHIILCGIQKRIRKLVVFQNISYKSCKNFKFDLKFCNTKTMFNFSISNLIPCEEHFIF